MKKYFIKLISNSLSSFPCERILIGLTHGKCITCTFGIFDEEVIGAHDITNADRYEKSLCSDNDCSVLQQIGNNLLGLGCPIKHVFNKV